MSPEARSFVLPVRVVVVKVHKQIINYKEVFLYV
jgi:hypothetical protein